MFNKCRLKLLYTVQKVRGKEREKKILVVYVSVNFKVFFCSHQNIFQLCCTTSTIATINPLCNIFISHHNLYTPIYIYGQLTNFILILSLAIECKQTQKIIDLVPYTVILEKILTYNFIFFFSVKLRFLNNQTNCRETPACSCINLLSYFI